MTFDPLRVSRLCRGASSVPKFNTVTSSADSGDKGMSCLMSKIAMSNYPEQSGWFPSAPLSRLFIPAAGSSKSKSFGFVAKALAISSFRCLP